MAFREEEWATVSTIWSRGRAGLDDAGGNPDDADARDTPLVHGVDVGHRLRPTAGLVMPGGPRPNPGPVEHR